MENRIETLLVAFDIIRSVKTDVEETSGKKRMAKHLDNALSELQIAIESEAINGKRKANR